MPYQQLSDVDVLLCYDVFLLPLPLITIYITKQRKMQKYNRSRNLMETIVVCPTILCSTSLLVFSLVAIIYATMMIYIPANLEMKANVTGPLKCTTIKMDFNVSQGNCHWSSCIEWCLNKVSKAEC